MNTQGLVLEETVHSRTHTAGREKKRRPLEESLKEMWKKTRHVSAGIDKVVGAHVHEESFLAP
jgi:hypothetical protein